MPVKDKLSGISLHTLIPLKNIERRIIIKDEPLSSSPFIIPKNRSVYSAFTGRIKELDYLRTLYSETITSIKKLSVTGEIQCKPIIAAIRGDAGIGKSRLVKEFICRIKNNSENKLNNVFHGSSLSTGQNSYGMFSGILRTRSQKIKNKQDTQNNIAVNNFIKETLFTEALACNKQNIPYIILLEDMQWADESSLAAMEHLLRSINLYPGILQPQILFILNYRSGFKPSKTLRTECDYRELELRGFTECETEKFIADLTGGNKINRKTREIISRRSDGNPFNIEEWCMLIAENKKLSQIPQTIRHLLVEKVEALSPEERSVLIIASVLGRKFELKILKDIQKRAGKEEATVQVMQSLIEKRFLVNLTGDVYEFRHDILQETIYRELRKDVKQNVHLLAGNAIEALFPGRLSNYYYELARHYVAAKNETKSIEYLEKSGDKAKDNYEFNMAIRYYKDFLNRVKINIENKINVIEKLAQIYKFKSEWGKAIELYYLIQRIIKDKTKNSFLISVSGIAEILLLKSHYNASIKEYKKLLKDARNEKYYLDGLCGIGRGYLAKGNYFNATKYFYKIVLYAKSLNNAKFIALSYEYLGRLSRIKGKFEKALKYYQCAISIYLEMNNKISLVSVYNKIGGVYFSMGKLSQAILYFKKAISINNKIGLYQHNINLYANIGLIYLRGYDFYKARINFEMQLKLANKIDNASSVASALNGLGNVCLYLLKLDEALVLYFKSLLINKKLNKKPSISYTLSNIGLIYYYKGIFKKAILFYNKQLVIDQKLGNTEGVIRACVNLANAIKYSGDSSKSERLYIKAIKLSRIISTNELLCIALYNLAELKFEVRDYGCSQKLNNEAYKLRETLIDNDLKFEIYLLRAKIFIYTKIYSQNGGEKNAFNINEDLILIKKLLLNENLLKRRASIKFELFKIYSILKLSIANKYKIQAISDYKKLFKEENLFYYKDCLKKLNVKTNKKK